MDADDPYPAHNTRCGPAFRSATPIARPDGTLRAIVERAIDRREHTVVACSALKERGRHTLCAQLRSVRFVYLRADRGLLERRLAERPSHFFGPALASSQLADLEEPGDALIVDAASPPQQILAAIRREFVV